jgi:hypothetical protein
MSGMPVIQILLFEFFFDSAEKKFKAWPRQGVFYENRNSIYEKEYGKYQLAKQACP